jgi:hypothetical protein
MAVRLIIKWEGDVPGLSEKRLSLNAFGSALSRLHMSLRRIATNIVNEALREKQAECGRFTDAARQLDIQMTSLVENSSGFESVVTIIPPQGRAFSLFEDLPENATRKLLDAIEAERQGILTNASVRQYLRSLPKGLSRQTYSIYRNGIALREISFGDVALAEVPTHVPYIAEYIGEIVGVGFEPGELEVRMKAGHDVVSLTATATQVETALKLRSINIRSLAVIHGSSRRLLLLQESSIPMNRSTQEAAIFQRWKGLLARLAH